MNDLKGKLLKLGGPLLKLGGSLCASKNAESNTDDLSCGFMVLT